jgi:hypothetical protein
MVLLLLKSNCFKIVLNLFYICFVIELELLYIFFLIYIIIMFKFCPNCGNNLSGGTSDVPKTEQFDSHKPKRNDDIDEEIDNQVIRKTIIKKKLTDKHLNALAENRKKLAEKRALAKKEKESNEEPIKKSKETPIENNTEKSQVFRRKLFD